MSIFPLTRRQLEPELMDQPDLDAQLHHRALCGLARINFFSASAGILWPSIRDLAKRLKTRTLTVLDVASGGGDVPIRFWRRAKRAGLSLKVTGCDISPVAVAFARKNAERQGVPVTFEEHDVLSKPLPGSYDVVMCSLFLHHLHEDQAVRLLTQMAQASQHLVLVNDLRRCLAGYCLAQLACRVLSRSFVVHVDGPRSVAAAFSLDEALTLAKQTPLERVQIERRWPLRFLLRGTPS